VAAGGGIDQLPCDAHPVRRLAHAAFEHVTDAELLSHSLHVDGAPLVDEARITRDDEQPAHPRQRGDNVFDDAVGKVFLLGIAAGTLIGAVQPFLLGQTASTPRKKTAVATATCAGLPKTPEMRKDAGAPAPSAKYLRTLPDARY
jgi:hypothetical protein